MEGWVEREKIVEGIKINDKSEKTHPELFNLQKFRNWDDWMFECLKFIAISHQLFILLYQNQKSFSMDFRFSLSFLPENWPDQCNTNQ